jgi:coenzyme F420-dependent glucose-6-phosphate dehydrogenase
VTDGKALDQAHAQWRFNAIGGDAATEFRTPAEFERAAESVKREDLRKSVIVTSDPARMAERLRQLAELGFESIDIHNVGTNQRAFIDMAGQKLLALLRS